MAEMRSRRSVGQVCSFCDETVAIYMDPRDPPSVPPIYLLSSYPSMAFFCCIKRNQWGSAEIRTEILNTVVGIIIKSVEKKSGPSNELVMQAGRLTPR